MSRPLPPPDPTHAPPRRYSTYYELYTRAAEKIAALREKKWLDTFITKCEAHERCAGLLLRDHLIEPVQRVPRYEMLLKEMARHTPLDDPQRQGLLDAIRKVQEVAHDIDRTITEKERREKVSELSKSWGVTFAAPSRIFVREGFLSDDAGNGTNRCFLLFNDLFVYGRARAASIVSTAISGGSAKRFKLTYQAPLNACMVVDADVVHLPNGETFSVPEVRAASTGGSKQAAHDMARHMMRLGIESERVDLSQVEDGVSFLLEVAGQHPRSLRLCASCIR